MKEIRKSAEEMYKERIKCTGGEGKCIK